MLRLPIPVAFGALLILALVSSSPRSVAGQTEAADAEEGDAAEEAGSALSQSPAEGDSTPEDEARTQEERLACVENYALAQRVRRAKRLQEARRLLILCSQEVCPDPVISDCVKWLNGVETAIPSIVVRALDPSGRDVVKAKVTLDHQLVAEELNGAALDLDPGQHALRIDSSGFEPFQQTLVVGEGEKFRAVTVHLKPLRATPARRSPPAEPPPEHRAGIPAASYLLGGVGVLGAGGFVGLGLVARKDERNLRLCKPECPRDEVDRVRILYASSNISLAVGAAALSGALALALIRPSRTRAAPHSWPTLAIQGTPGGGRILLHSKF